jgi:hypothetical protein
MVGFMCYVQGKLDPSEFFCGLQLSFGDHPHLLQLKNAIEERVTADSVIPDGSDYAVGDLEILDFRLNAWVPLDSRSQLYSGCFVAAIRDDVSATAAGAVDRANRKPETHVMGFALEARRLFDGLDADKSGVLTMRGMLRALRHDVNYAIDLFSSVDRRATGNVTFQDFMSEFNERKPQFWHELALRLEHGGKLPGAANRSSTLFMPAGTYAEQQKRTVDRMGLSSGAAARRASIASPDRTGETEDVSSVAADVLSSFETLGKDGASTQQGGAIASPLLVPLPKLRPDPLQASYKSGGPGSPGGNSLEGSPDGDAASGGGQSPRSPQLHPTGSGAAAAGDDAARREQARKVVSLLQNSIDRKRQGTAQPSKIGQKLLSAMRTMRPRATPGAAGASPAGGGGTGIAPASPSATQASAASASPSNPSLGGRPSAKR